MKKFFCFLSERWKCEGGYRELFFLSFPLILSTSAWTIQHFVDRLFLSRYSTEAIAAALPAGLLNGTITSIFTGTATFVSTFVAQYYGAERFEKIGKITWQGLYLSIAGGITMLLLMLFSGFFFTVVGHPAEVAYFEKIYFRILCLGAFPAIASSAIAGFFSGRGHTLPVMWMSFLQTGINIFLDYCLIFGRWGFPKMGIKGAAIATVIATFITFGIYLSLFIKDDFNTFYATRKNIGLDFFLFKRLLHFGLPNGIQWFIDMAGFSLFLLFIGRLGLIPLAATNISFNINTLAFMPMIGIGMGVSILVGQKLGKNDVYTAEKSVYSGFHITFFYMGTIALLYVFLPDIFIKPFAPRIYPVDFERIHGIAIILLRFIAFYSLFDTMNIIFASALKGAGDTRYIVKSVALVSLFILVIPSYISVFIFKKDIYTVWIIATMYVIILGFTFFFRFLKGKWKKIRVIEVSVIE
ncbi:MAG: MATE family efflux transporter [Candidatus Omnitrophica bacterium]|nr:MATE family efflux transporter [Candidatus Omnitrophota bacterium]